MTLRQGLERIRKKPAGWVSDFATPAVLVSLVTGAVLTGLWLGAMRADIDTNTTSIAGLRTDVAELQRLAAAERAENQSVRERVELLITLIQQRAGIGAYPLAAPAQH